MTKAHGHDERRREKRSDRCVAAAYLTYPRATTAAVVLNDLYQKTLLPVCPVETGQAEVNQSE